MTTKTKQIRPFLKWAGGKSRILDRITAVLPPPGPATRCLIEPFVGGAAVFLNTDYPYYILSDVNKDLINTYKVLQQGGLGFIDYAKRYFTDETNTPEAYYEYRTRFNGSLSNIERAALFLYLNRHGFNGLCRYNQSGGYNVPFGKYKRPYFPEKEMIDFFMKSKRASFHCVDYSLVMGMSGAGDVIYCDPPYIPLTDTANFTTYSSGGFTIEDQRRLATAARKAADRDVPVVISNHDTPFTRELYAGARIESFNVQRSISCDGENRGKAQELLAIFNAKEN